nr:hypothetical protein [Tanacetum cinerariifolium]
TARVWAASSMSSTLMLSGEWPGVLRACSSTVPSLRRSPSSKFLCGRRGGGFQSPPLSRRRARRQNRSRAGGRGRGLSRPSGGRRAPRRKRGLGLCRRTAESAPRGCYYWGGALGRGGRRQAKLLTDWRPGRAHGAPASQGGSWRGGRGSGLGLGGGRSQGQGSEQKKVIFHGLRKEIKWPLEAGQRQKFKPRVRPAQWHELSVRAHQVICQRVRTTKRAAAKLWFSICRRACRLCDGGLVSWPSACCTGQRSVPPVIAPDTWLCRLAWPRGGLGAGCRRGIALSGFGLPGPGPAISGAPWVAGRP